MVLGTLSVNRTVSYSGTNPRLCGTKSQAQVFILFRL